jgi:putative ABC transport system ATP-binding protein
MKMATRSEKHQGETRVHAPPDSGAGQAASAGSATYAVQVVSISKSYGHRGHRVDALQDVTASFARGTLTAVMGLSGCGKSTLLQCAAGLDKPTAGSVRIGGPDVTRLSRRKLSVFRRERVGFVFQALNLVPTLSVAENIALPLRLDGRHVDHKRVRGVAGQVGIADQLRRLPDTLSGGQRQRVAIARALITDPWVIFADEPTAARPGTGPCSSRTPRRPGCTATRDRPT